MAIRISNYFFWLKWVDKVLAAGFWWMILMAFVFWLPPLRPWWWLFFPFFLSFELKKLYLWWIRWDYYYAKFKWVTLEVIPPKDVLTPLKAMEDVFSGMWGPLYDEANWRERWFEGELPDTPFWMSWEIASIEGKLHFYLRTLTRFRLNLENAIYAYYPELEFQEVPDYTKNIPQNIPNSEWDLYGEDFILGKPDVYPIKTYERFFEPQGERITAEEKRIDPINSLLETMAKLGPGEHFWLQIITMATSDKYEPHIKSKAEEIINKITKRPVAKKRTFIGEIIQVFHEVIVGPKKEGSGEKTTYKWLEAAKSEGGEREMLLTPGEREILTEVEKKLSKPMFRTTLRGVYIAKRENWRSSYRILTRSYFSHFQTGNLNHLRFSTRTRPKTHYVFRRRIPFLRARRMFRNYVLRFPSFFPDRKTECPILNVEELATLFHFPLKISGMVMPTMERVESKKGGPPPNLPVE